MNTIDSAIFKYCNIEFSQNAVSKCPAAGQGLKWTKCPAVRNFHRIPTAGKILSNFLVVFDVFLKMQSDSKNYASVQDDEITDLVQSQYKIGSRCLTQRYLKNCYRKLLLNLTRRCDVCLE